MYKKCKRCGKILERFWFHMSDDESKDVCREPRRDEDSIDPYIDRTKKNVGKFCRKYRKQEDI